MTGKDLPALVDDYKAQIGSGAVLLIADAGGKAAVAAGVTADKAEAVSAVDLVRAAVAELGAKAAVVVRTWPKVAARQRITQTQRSRQPKPFCKTKH